MSRQIDKFGNYSIPIKLSDELIDSLDKELFENPSYKFCYATVVDDYIISKIIDKLMIGLSNIIIDENERYNHIISNMIYCIAINDIAYLTIKKLFPDLKNIFLRDISKEDISDMPKFDFIIQNPPYKGTTHIKFFDKGLDLLSNKGQMIIIEPATWLQDVKYDGRGNANKFYKPLKDKIKKHVKSINVDRMNEEFGIGLYMPLSITSIDMSKEYDNVDFNCAGEEKKVSSIYDCNHIGDYKLIESIINKCKNKDVMANHKTNDTFDDNNIKYLRYATIITMNGYDSRVDVIKHKYGKFYGTYITPCLHKNVNHILDKVPKTKAGNKASCVYGTKEEMENWKYFILNNKFPLFLNMILTIDQHNNSEKYMPWIVDGQYSDKEIYNRLGFDKDEINLIDEVVKKFEYSSNWFKRYMTGDTSIEINQEKPWLPVGEN